MNQTELEIVVKQAKCGDQKAIEKLYKEYHNKLYFFVLKNVGNKEIAEDITEETFLSSIQGISSLKNIGNYETWLHSIAYNKCKEYFRKESKNDNISLDDDANNFQNQKDETIMLPDDYAANKEIKHHLKNVIDDLKPDMKSAVILYYYDDMSVKKVSKVLGISENAVKQKLHKARVKIKKEIENLFDGSVLSAVPISVMMKDCISPKYASSVASAPSVSTSSVVLKAVGVVAAAGVAIGVPITLNISGNKGFGVYDNSSSPYNASIYSYESDSEKESTYSDEAVESESNKNIESSSLSDDTESFEDISESSDKSVTIDKDNKTVDIYSEADNSVSYDLSESSFTGEDMFSKTIGEMLELSGNNYEMIYPTAVQDGSKSVYKCAEFPEYCFSAAIYDPQNGELLNKPEQQITILNLYKGAYITDDIYVGMTYNELSEALGCNIGIISSNCDIPFVSSVTINGRKWYIGYELTEDQENDIRNRMIEKTDGDLLFGDTTTDISDINPISRVAVCDMNNQ